MNIGDGKTPMIYMITIKIVENSTERGEPTLTEAQINQLEEIASPSDEAGPRSGLSTLSINFLNGCHTNRPEMICQSCLSMSL